jgi:hypothetical protein
MSRPERRRILIKGLAPDAVADRVAEYDTLYPNGEGRFEVAVHEARGEWVPVEVPVGLDVPAFHNLAKWMEGDDETTGADDVVALSHGPGDWAYWLVPMREEGKPDWYLTGAFHDGIPFQWDCVARQAVDDPRLQRAPMGLRTMLMTRGVHATLHAPDAEPPPAVRTVTLHLDVEDPAPIQRPEPGSLSETFERTPGPDAGGGMEQVLSFLGGLFGGGGKDRDDG